MGRTHMLGGAAAWLGGAAMTHPTPGVAAAGAGLAMAAALAPDIDHARSDAHTALGPLGWAAYHATRPRHGGNRGPVHSWAGLAACQVAVWAPWVFTTTWPAWAALAVTAGWCSHLALDACNREGIPLAWPARTRVGVPHCVAITTGGKRRRRGRRRRGAEYWLVQPTLAVGTLVAAVTVLHGG